MNVLSVIPSVCSFPLRSDDLFMILATDGVWDRINSQEATNIVLEGLSVIDHGLLINEKARKCAALVCEEARARGSEDNLTCMVVIFG